MNEALAPVVAPVVEAQNLIDFSAFTSELTILVGVVVAAFAAYGLKRLFAWIKTKTGVDLKATEERVQKLVAAMIAAAVAQAIAGMSKSKLAQVKTKSAIVASVTNLVLEQGTDLVKQLSLKPADIEVLVAKELEKRLG